MEPVRLMVARFPFGRSEDPDVVDWITTTVITARHDPRVKEILRWRKDDTPITLSRNACFEIAKGSQVDFLLMVDSDMSPDCHLEANIYHQLPANPQAKPFFDSSFDFLWQQRKAGKPSVVAAPYCGPPPHENVYVFRWATFANSPSDEPDVHLEQYTREEAACMEGIQEAAALPTGLILMDMDCLQRCDPPYTYYEWGDPAQSVKASTEDVTLTRDLGLAGVPMYCNWDAWAGHWKWKCVCKPVLLTTKMVGDKFRKRVLLDMGISYDDPQRSEPKKETFIRVAPARGARGHRTDDVEATGQPAGGADEG